MNALKLWWVTLPKLMRIATLIGLFGIFIGFLPLPMSGFACWVLVKVAISIFLLDAIRRRDWLNIIVQTGLLFWGILY